VSSVKVTVRRAGNGSTEQEATSGMAEWIPDDEYKTFMVVVAHPDDLEFSSAGTVARWVQRGMDAILVQVTSGDRGSPDPNMTPERLTEIREQEQREAAAVLGIKEVVFLREPDGQTDNSYRFRGRIVHEIRRFKPDIVITHDPWRPYALHPDHRNVGITTTDAIYPTARDAIYFPEHYHEEGLEPHKVAELLFFNAEHPDCFVDVSSTFDTKLEALRHHDSQVGQSKDLEKRLRERLEEIGKQADLPMAEAFRRLTMRR